MRIVPLILLCAGCAAAVDSGDDGAFSARALGIPAADAQRVLDFVNYPGTDAAVLDQQVGLDARAATGIVAKRPFATLADLDAVSYVGDAALQKLETYAAAHPAPVGEVVEDVAFAGWQSVAVVWGVNQATQAELDGVLDQRAAVGLAAKRPFASVAQMGPVPYVGAAALGKLRDHAGVWWAAMRGAPPLAGTFDSVAFDEATAGTALAIANGATGPQLTGHAVTATAATKIAAGRPFTTLAQVAALTGVGTATMTALKTYAQSGSWAPAPADCVSTFDDAVGPHLPDLLFLSESDRPIELVSFPGKGGTVPTPSSLMALVTAEAGSSAESRDPADYLNNLEQASSTADPNAAAAVQAALAAQLTDVVYIVIYPPKSSYNHAEMAVYLLGRTACGDLVGIRSISVET